MSVKPFLGWAVGIIIVVGLPVSLWLISTAGVSPDQRAADAEAPPPPIIEGTVEERRLVDSVVFRGNVVASDVVDVFAPEIADGLAVLMDVPVKVGTEVRAGDVLAVVSDRPVLVLPMAEPLYRTLTPGDQGPDVERLQQSLNSMGHDLEVDALFGPQTQTAVASLYREAGFEPVRTGSDLDDALRATEGSVREAEDALEDARRGGDAIAIRRAAEDLEERRLERRRAADKVGYMVPVGEFVGFSQLPAVVVSAAKAGLVVSDSALVLLTEAPLRVEATLETHLASFLPPGTFASGGEGGEISLTVVNNQRRDDAGMAIVELAPSEDLAPDMIGRDLRIEAELAATDGPVLAVPSPAIRREGGRQILRLVDRAASSRDIEVVTGVTIGGWVEIVDSAVPLEPGMSVVLG